MSTTLLIIIGVVVLVVLMSLALSIASFSNDRFLQEYEKLANEPTNENLNILDFVHLLNHNKFGGKIRVQSVEKDTENFYVSKAKVVALSQRTLSSNTLASFAIVAHEMGHALQDQEGKKLARLNFLRRVGSFIGFLFLPSILAGIILLFWGDQFKTISFVLFGVAAAILLLAVIIKSATISIEKDASEKGIEFLQEILSDDEVSKCRKLLNTARLTYWGDLFRLLLSWTLLTKKTTLFR